MNNPTQYYFSSPLAGPGTNVGVAKIRAVKSGYTTSAYGSVSWSNAQLKQPN